MEISDKLQEFGWYISPEGIQQIGDNGDITDARIIRQRALDYDLREIGAPAFPEEINKTKLESIPGKIVVQIQKVRNVSAPKVNEESRGAPRMLKLTLTDGHISCQAVELQNIPSLSLNTPPGTKLYLKDETIPMAHNILLLTPSCVDILGGKVAALIEKWELNRSLAKHTRGRIGEEGGPPPWIPFGQKILRLNPNDRNFKSLENSRDKENKENAEFEAQRKDAIAEAARGGAKKVFGGGNKPLLDHNVQQIVDSGFTVEQAEYALRQTRNNVERALRTLQKRIEGASHDDSQRPEGKPKEERERRKRGERGDRDEEGGLPSKPTGSLSLFDFVQNKLPFQNDKDMEQKPSYMSSSSDHKMSSPDTHKGGSGTRGGRSDRGGASLRGGNRGNKSGRGGRGGSSWNSGSGSDFRDSRDRGNSGSLYHHNNMSYRDDRAEKSKHGSGMGSGPGGSSQQQHQKPPRFQNQQRYQQQQQQQHHQQQQTPQDMSYGEQNWMKYSGYGGMWPGRNTAMQGIGTKSRTDYSAPQHDSYGTVDYNDSNRKKSSRQLGSEEYGNKFDTHDSQTSHGLGGRNDAMGNVRTFGHQELSKFSNHNNGSLSREAFDTGSYARQNEQSNEMYTMNFSFKDPPPSSQSNSHSVSNVSSAPSYGSNAYSSQQNYTPMVPSTGPPSNQYIPDSKAWQWHKGDKCMAKYWEDNMYYNAEVTGVSERTCVVRFVEYGNFEEVLQDDCIPFTEDGLGHSIQTSGAFLNSVDSIQSQPYNQIHFSGILEFRRGGTRPYIKSGGGETTGNRDRRPPRIQQQMYIPPAQRK